MDRLQHRSFRLTQFTCYCLCALASSTLYLPLMHIVSIKLQWRRCSACVRTERKNACSEQNMLPFRRSFVCCVSNSSVSSIRLSFFLWHFNIRLFYLAFNVCVQQHTTNGRWRKTKKKKKLRTKTCISAWERTQRMKIVVILGNLLKCSTTMSMRCDKWRDVDRTVIERSRERAACNVVPISSQL